MRFANLKHPNHKRRWQSLLWWLVLTISSLVALAVVQLSLQLDELDRESNELHRLASQRVGQHDAHLTALSAIAIASAGLRPDLFLDVAATISRFYPRIDEVQLVPLDPTSEVVGSMSLTPEASAAIRAAAGRSARSPVLLPHPSRAQHYMIIKRSPNSDNAIYALMLSIDAVQLVSSDAVFWSRDNVSTRLSLPGYGLLFEPTSMNVRQFAKPLESASQPLQLETGIRIGFGDLLPPLQVLIVVLAVSLAYFVALTTLRQRARVRAAERDADMQRMEAQLTHASRVNSMGELASGMAHELTQPLTAILAEAQAGRRLLVRGDTGILDAALEDIGAQAKRASAILERLRNWSRPQRAPIAAIDLRDALHNVRTLLLPEAERRGVSLRFDVPEHAIVVLADQVEMEQVLHNIIRNAFEALEEQSEGEVNVLAKVIADDIVFEITDNGPGVDKGLRPQLFTPFMTTREHGTGLGLALSQRLVERAGGDISYVGSNSGAKFRIVLPLAEPIPGAAQ